METIEDESGRLPWPREQNAGGADLLRRQAACPFQAFATKRLGAEAIEEEDWGLSPAERGKLLHEVMRRLFTAELPARIRTRDDIVAALAHNQTAAILDVHIDAAMHAVLGPAPSDLWLTAWLDAEKRRLRTRIQEWLACEARRQPFTVEACEQPLHDVHIGELRLNLRTDRIDLLPDGSRFLLDYKTGAVSAAAWKGDRPDEPQLPLYAAYGNVENVSGVLFAKIRAGETGFDGRVRDARAQLCAEMGARKALVTDPYSESMRDKWARALETLAAAFLEGVATVSPREPQVCEHCPLPALCRKAELNIAASETDEEGIDG
jgi:RecB family exonuclease